jgi:Ser/Thr protein kinase RdoA (MazF antagonist)
MKNNSQDNILKIADRFLRQGEISNIEAFGSGNINDTFLVKVNGSERKYFILQRINSQVFPQPELVMQNMFILTDRVRGKLEKMPLDRRWEIPQVLLTEDKQNYVRDNEGSFWRAISFIEGSQSFDTMQDTEQAQEIGYALATFHKLIEDLPADNLADTLPGFHITPLYLQHYQKVLAKTSPFQSPEVNYCLQFISDRHLLAHVLENAKNEGKLPLRIMHGDPKINNVMFDTATNKAVSVIDLDTVKPGLIHYDIGDCLRSGCNLAGEETQAWESVCFDTDLCQGILQGYLSVAKSFLTPNDRAYIHAAIRSIAFELGLRFFTDYLAGNIYFKVKHPEHNLARALVQFKLTESIESQERTIGKIIEDAI